MRRWGYVSNRSRELKHAARVVVKLMRRSTNGRPTHLASTSSPTGAPSAFRRPASRESLIHPRAFSHFALFVCTAYSLTAAPSVAEPVSSLNALVTASVLADGEGSATAQRNAPGLSSYAPASANLFVAARRLDDVDDAMRRAHAWRLFGLLRSSTGESGTEFDLRRSLESFLGDEGSIPVESFMSCPIGFVAESWVQPRRAVWLLQPSEKDFARRWFPEGDKKRNANRAAQFYGTRNGLLVGIKDDLAAVARRGGGALLRDVMLLLAGRGGEVIGTDSAYQKLTSYLPGDALAVAYAKRGDQTYLPLPGSDLLLADAEQAVVGLYEGDGRLELAVRATRTKTTPGPRISPDFGKAVGRLPQTTVAVSAFPLDALLVKESETPGSAVLRRLWRYLAPHHLKSEEDQDLRAGLDDHVIVALDQDMRPGRSTPQVAIMVRGESVRRLERQVSATVRSAAASIMRYEGARLVLAPSVENGAHLGAGISWFDLSPFASRSRIPVIQLLSPIEPAWVVDDDWFILALSRDHLERILDARRGLAPTLLESSDVQSVLFRSVDRTTLALAQPDLVAGVVEQWLAAFRAGEPSLLNPDLWRADSADTRRVLPLGLELAPVATSGVAVVAAVDARSPAASLLQAGDRIHGVNNRLLALVDTNQELAQRLDQLRGTSTITLRIERAGSMFDVKVPGDVEAPARSASLSPEIALEEIASLGRSLQFASFSTFSAPEGQYSARVSLRFNPPSDATARTSTSEAASQ